jgi:cadmium resistance protein CadD (predicted permease)
MNNLRKYFTTATAFSFLLVGGTGVYFKLFSKNHTLEEIHTWAGIMMVLVALVHVYQNFKSMINHLKQSMVYLTLIPLFIIIGIFTFSDSKEERGINPKMAMERLVQSKVTTVSEVFKKQPQDVLLAMKNDGIESTSADQTLEEIAQINHIAPPKVLSYFK